MPSDDTLKKLFVSTDEGQTFAAHDLPAALHKIIPNPLDPAMFIGLSYIENGAVWNGDVRGCVTA